MTPPIALVRLPDSPLADDLAGILARADRPSVVLDLDATLEGEPVTVRGDEVLWQGCPLHEAAALWLEAPVFPWPQALPPPCPLPDIENLRRWQTYQREARALALGALCVAADHAPAVNPPASSHLAVAPTVALDRLAAAGLAVQPWSVGGMPLPGATARDATGRDRRHPAAPLPDDAPRLVHHEFAGPVDEMLVVGGRVVGALRWSDGPAWAARSAPAPADAGLDAMESAVRAAEALELEVVQVACRCADDGPRILLADAAPRLAAWNRLLAGAVATALAGRLGALADERRGRTS